VASNVAPAYRSDHGREPPHGPTRSPTSRATNRRLSLQPDLSELITRIGLGEGEALSQLYECTAGSVFALARNILRNEADAEEVVSDVYVYIWQAAPLYNCARGTVLAWILTICRSRSIDRYRSMRRDGFFARASQIPSDTPSDSVLGDVLLTNRQEAVVDEALAKLSPLRRRLLFLSFFRGLSHESIALEMGIPVGTAKSHLRRTLQSLRSSLERPTTKLARSPRQPCTLQSAPHQAAPHMPRLATEVAL
jgi:RNA polymerase sigma-70 factor, ECF subfamily